MLAEKDSDVQFFTDDKEMVCKQNSCTWETLVHSTSSDQEIHCDQTQMTMDKRRLSEEQKKATTVLPAYMKNVNVQKWPL